MTKISIEKEGMKLNAVSPYHPSLPAKAKKLGGRWDAGNKSWTFDARDEERVRELYRNVYGTDGTDAGEVVTVRARCKTSVYADRGALFIGPREIARAYDRDSGAKLSEGVVLLFGTISSGGSRKNWSTFAEVDTVVEVRDVPRKMAESMADDNVKWDVEIVDETIDIEELQAEKERLLARVAEIDAQLNGVTK